MKQPNVLLFISHDTGRHISPCDVAQVRTPHAERMAREGVNLTNVFCTSPLCAPARSSLVTGRFPHQNGVMGLPGDRTGGWDLYPRERHAASVFTGAAYDTVLCGSEHETPDWHGNAGFAEAICGSGGRHNGGGDLREYADGFGAWLDRRDSGRPFYCQVGCHETHHGYDKFDVAPDTSGGLWMPPHLEESEALRAEMAGLQGAVNRLDAGFGRMLDALDRRGLADDTIVVFTTDHGIDLPLAKGTCFDRGIEIFQLLRYPNGGWNVGAAPDAMISGVDLLPTLLDACGIDHPEGLAGRSFLPLLRGEPYAPREAIFAGKTFHDSYDPVRCVRTARYKYIRFFEACIFQDLRLWTVNHRELFPRVPLRTWFEELYDLEEDPHEQRNLAEDPRCAALKGDLSRALLRQMEETDDPLLDGPVESPRYRAARVSWAGESVRNVRQFQ